MNLVVIRARRDKKVIPPRVFDTHKKNFPLKLSRVI